jgi:KDO2-lipid IV(A) lauroyltransferase
VPRLTYDPETLSRKHRLELAFVKALRQRVLNMKREDAVVLGGRLGGFIHDVWKKRREIATNNIRLALPHLPREEQARIVRLSFVNFGMTLIEFILLPKTPNELGQRLLNTIGYEQLYKVLEKGKGAIILTGHFGSWELAGAGFRFFDIPTSFVVGRQKNLAVNALMNQTRASVGLKLIELEEAARGMIKALRANDVLCTLADQDAGKDGIFVPFLGKLASTTRGPALFAAKTGAPLIPCFAVRKGVMHHDVYMTEPIYADPDLDLEENERIMMTEYNRRLGYYACKYPELYYWMHRRFKTTPPEGSS